MQNDPVSPLPPGTELESDEEIARIQEELRRGSTKQIGGVAAAPKFGCDGR